MEATDLFNQPISEDQLDKLIEIFVDSISFHEQKNPSRETISQVMVNLMRLRGGGGDVRTLPNYNQIFVGRDTDVIKIKTRLGLDNAENRQALTIIRGFPGVGKTAFVNNLVRDTALTDAFADGILWTQLSRESDLFRTLRQWAEDLNQRSLLQKTSRDELREGIKFALQGKDILLVIDDVWEISDGLLLKDMVDLKHNTIIFTTRFTDIATQLRDYPSDVYVLESLNEKYSLELLSILAPEPTKIYYKRMPELVRNVEGLPLALRVAGPLLQYYYELGFDIDTLLDEFEQDYRRLLQSDAPADRFDELTGRTPTIELLFQRSIETLLPDAQLAFADLGVFKEKPATFSKEAMLKTWEVGTTETMIMTLVGRGLLDVTSNQRYRMHQTLHSYANMLLDRYDSTGNLL